MSLTPQQLADYQAAKKYLPNLSEAQFEASLKGEVLPEGVPAPETDDELRLPGKPEDYRSQLLHEGKQPVAIADKPFLKERQFVLPLVILAGPDKDKRAIWMQNIDGQDSKTGEYIGRKIIATALECFGIKQTGTTINLVEAIGHEATGIFTFDNYFQRVVAKGFLPRQAEQI